MVHDPFLSNALADSPPTDGSCGSRRRVGSVKDCWLVIGEWWRGDSLLVLLLFFLFHVIVTGQLRLERSLLRTGTGLSFSKGEFLGLLEALVNGGEWLLLHSFGILTDCLMDLLEQLLNSIGIDVILDVLGEVFVVHLLIIFLELTHVISDVLTHDTSFVNFSVEILGVTSVTRESLLAVRNIEATITGTLHSTKDLGTSGGVLDTNIKESTEWLSLVINFRDVESLLAVLGGDGSSLDLFNTRVDLIETNFLEKSAGKEKTSGVGSSIVLQTNWEAVSGQFSGAGLAEDFVTIDFSVDHLAEDILVGETNTQSVLVGVVLVLVLGDELVTLTIVSLSL